MRSSSFARVVMASLGVSVLITLGCDVQSHGTLTAPTPTVTVEFGGRVVNADAGGPVANVRVSLDGSSSLRRLQPIGWVFPKNTATSGGDGTFALPLNLPIDWRCVCLKFDRSADTTLRAGASSRRRPSDRAVLGCRRSSGDQDVSDARDQARRID